MSDWPKPQCRICGVYLSTGLLGMPQPLLPGDIPARSEVCGGCADKSGPLPDKPYTPSWAVGAVFDPVNQREAQYRAETQG